MGKGMSVFLLRGRCQEVLAFFLVAHGWVGPADGSQRGIRYCLSPFQCSTMLWPREPALCSPVVGCTRGAVGPVPSPGLALGPWCIFLQLWMLSLQSTDQELGEAGLTSACSHCHQRGLAGLSTFHGWGGGGVTQNHLETPSRPVPIDYDGV